jgi:hypothetical protein
MANLQAFWKEVRRRASAIPDEWPYVTAVMDRGREMTRTVVSQVSRDEAAELIVRGSHRISYADEVRDYLAAEEAERERVAAIERDRVLRMGAHLLPGFAPPPAAKRSKDAGRE